MHVLMVTVPGSRIQAEDRARAREIESLVRLLESKFIDASVALNLFTEETVRLIARLQPTAYEEARDPVRDEMQEELERRERELGSDSFWQNYPAIRQEATLTVYRRRWQQGEWPEEFERRKVFLHGHSFLFAVDDFCRALAVLARVPGVPEPVAAEAAALRRAFPQLKGVRDSAVHLEDRGRGVGKGGQPLELKPIDNRLIKASGGVLALGNLNGSKLGYTTEAGEYSEIDVSVESLSRVRDAFQRVVDALPWHGMPKAIPHTAIITRVCSCRRCAPRLET